MNFNEKLNKYAQLIIEVGSNIQKGDTLSINAPVERADFARMLAENAYKRGAYEVVINWVDGELTKLHYQYSPTEVMKEVPQYAFDRAMYYAEERRHKIIGISASNPELLKDIDPKKIQEVSLANSKVMQPLRKYTMNDIVSWTVVSVPTKDWAKKVFPNSENPVDDLWEAIFKTVRVDREDPVKAWKEHLDVLTEKANWLNDENFKYLRYKSSNGTDLEIELPKGHIWTAASSLNEKGESFVPNMPTEEVFTLPHKDGVNGKVVASKPLVYDGNVIDKFYFEFKDGAVVNFDAEVGLETLKSIFEKDERARRLGEVALVPFDSPISNSNILFYNTLFDENASCHLALGKAYPTTIKGGEKMSDEELAQHGVNDSYAHEDFMVGTKDLDIIGVKEDGSEVQIFRNGNWA